MKKNYSVFTSLLAAVTLVIAVTSSGIIKGSTFKRSKAVNVVTQYETASNEKLLIPGGDAFGIKLYTDGCIVIELSDFESENGKVCPAKSAGIKVNDIIISVNGNKISSNSDISDIVQKNGNNAAKITYKRNDKIISTVLTPEKSASEKEYKTGMWVRDSTAGIGTVTYYDPYSGTMAGLGHGISDISTGLLMPAAKGEIIGARITGIKSGEKGDPGQLLGYLDTATKYGELTENSEMGVYAVTDSDIKYSESPLPIADSKDVHTGDAYIISTVNENGKACYAVKIESLNPISAGNKNMVIKITDKDLISKTGGIVQGMSGSPIIQDGKIVGAVTHVFVNDPTKGYGIFIGNMLQNAA